MEKILDKFLRYIAIDTQSDESFEGGKQPSAERELNLSRLLVKELQAMGVANASLDENGYVMASIPATSGYEKVPAVGFIAHVDTSPDAPGACTKPQIIPDYDGKDIPLRGVPGLQLKVSEFPELADYKGQTLITTDGTTLLGADDKAGVAEILCAMEYLLAHPEVPHGKLCIGFTPDEEIGCGVDHFDVKRFGADYAYTMDGGAVGELEYENFNAAGVKIRIQGRNVHPGYAKGKMINALHVAHELDALLPAGERPEHTEGYEGFYHLTGMTGNEEAAELKYILRDHDRDKLEARKTMMNSVCEMLNRKYGEGTVRVELKDSYRNMKEIVEQHPEILQRAEKAFRVNGVEPIVKPIRGGTDGAQLSFRGLPCPNLSTGGYNFHGRKELIPVGAMEKMVDVLAALVSMK
jgi:tripeptide aminopeptidase